MSSGLTLFYVSSKLTAMTKSAPTAADISIAARSEDHPPLPYVYWDTETDAENPDWVLRYWHKANEDETWAEYEALQANDADGADEAVAEAAAFLARNS